MTNELARREILISRVVTELIHYTQAELRIEYNLKVSNWLQGNLDYLLRVKSVNQLLVIEAKYEDLTRGFTQLVAELVALDQWSGSTTLDQQPILIGVVSTGTIWQFGRLDRNTKHFEQGINSYRLSSLPLTISFPSRLKSADRTRLVCPCKIFKHFPVLISQILNVLSSLPLPIV